MWRGYKLKIDSKFFSKIDVVYTRRNGQPYRVDQLEKNYKAGLEAYASVQNEVKEQLDDFIRNDGMVDAAMLEKAWFPNLKCDVFLSHSHSDEKLAIAFANWLKQKFGISTFIDSTVWGYALDLQRELDDRYNKKPDGMGYYYEGSNRVCGFVDMLLATSLSKMIDNCECLMFLETGNSIIPTNKSNQETSSPWIYHELLQSKIIEKKYLRPKTKMFSQGGRVVNTVTESRQTVFRPALPAETGHLYTLNDARLLNWLKIYQDNSEQISAYESLDLLYRLTTDDQKRIIQ
jgi:hypothetical protein